MNQHASEMLQSFDTLVPTLGSIDYETDMPNLEFLSLSEDLQAAKSPENNILGGLTQNTNSQARLPNSILEEEQTERSESWSQENSEENAEREKIWLQRNATNRIKGRILIG